ncbi:MAG: STAS domain-containing protein [Planctomycetota bacterium]|nr:STAS domain-containing protein [Planctomycetota bacterium]
MSEMIAAPARRLHIELRPVAFGAECEIILKGAIGTSNFIDLHRCLTETLAAHPEKIHINMEEVTFLSAAGVWVLLEAQVRARSQGAELVINRCSPAVHNILELLGVSDALLAAGVSF